MKPYQSIVPTTLDGIKRLAKAIKRELGITHSAALDLAAQQGRFENFRHASTVLAQPPVTTRKTES